MRTGLGVDTIDAVIGCEPVSAGVIVSHAVHYTGYAVNAEEGTVKVVGLRVVDAGAILGHDPYVVGVVFLYAVYFVAR